MPNHQLPVWGIAIFAARESIQDIERTINAAIEAATDSTVVDVLVNGNQELADETTRLVRNSIAIKRKKGVAVRVWFIPLGDKAHTWNQYLQFIWPESKIAFFVDGYVRINTDALRLLDKALSNSTDYLAATGVPSIGFTSKALRDEMLRNGGLHGNFFALKASTMEALRHINFKLPLGLYRTDSTLGAALAFGLNPSLNSWNPKGQILVHPDVSWSTDEKKLWRLTDVAGQAKRVLRQGQGILENLAVKNLFSTQKLAPGQLPSTAANLVLQWANSHPRELQKAIFRHPLLIGLALRRLHQPRDWSQAQIPPEQKNPETDAITQ